MKQESIVSTEPVPFREITVIIHGPVIHDPSPGAPAGMTRAAVLSVRRVLPGAKVILSTWAGSSAENLGADRVVYSPDPGGSPYGPGERLNNVNRQIAALRPALELVETRWAMKLRSDTVLVTAGMVTHWHQHPARHPCLRVFDRRIVTSAILTHHPRLYFAGQLFTPFLFHVNDMMQFGLTSDLRRLWEIPFMPEGDFTYFTKQDLQGKRENISNRRVPEDYIWTAALASAGHPTNDSWMDFRPSLIPLSELSIVNNFQLLDHDEMGFHCLKYPDFGEAQHATCSPFFTHREWLMLYKVYCDPAVEVPPLPRFSAASFGRGLRNCLNIPRGLKFLKLVSRPARYRLKEFLRRRRLWK